MTLLVGVHPNNLHLQIAALSWTDANASGITFVPYPEGRTTGALIESGSIDVGGTGSTPPLIAQAEGIRFRYVGASAPRQSNGAIVTRADGPDSLAGLAGKRIALLDGSFHTSFLASALDELALSLSDVELVELAPGAALAALREGRVDGWVAMEPLLASIEGDAAIKAVAWIGDYARNRSVFWASDSAVHDKAEEIAALLRRLDALGAHISRDPGHYAELLTQAKLGGVGLPSWTQALKRRDWTIHSIDKLILAEQQQEADLLFRHGALSKQIDVGDCAPPPIHIA